MNCRFLYLVGQLGPGGLERQLYLLLKTIDRARYRPQLVVWNFNQNDTYVPVIEKLGVPLRSLSGDRIEKLLRFRQLIRKIRPEVVHSYTFYTNFAALSGTLGTNITAVGSVRSDLGADKHACGLLLGTLSARWPKTQIYNNLAAANRARSLQTWATPKRIILVRNAIDLEQFRNVPFSTDGLVRIVGVGSLLPLKRWDRLLKASAILKARGFKFLVEIAGDGPLRESLELMARDLTIADTVRFRGYTDDIPTLLAGASFLAHTSDIEGCPNVVMEAMACGRAVVATDAGDVPNLVDDGKTGFVVRRGDDARLVDCLATLILDRELCSAMGCAARLKANLEFTPHRMVQETIAGYCAAGWKDPAKSSVERKR